MNYYTRMIAVLLVSMAISWALTWYFSRIMPFGFVVGLALSFAVFILISIYIRKRRIGGPTGLFGSGINYICIACGHRFKGGICPRCGSKMRKAEF